MSYFGPSRAAAARHYTEARAGTKGMQAYKKEFIDLALELGVLKFGEFTLKSGRTSP